MWSRESIIDHEHAPLLGGHSHGSDESALQPRQWRPVVPRSRKQLGTFAGVFVPCSFNVIGVILFERMLWAVGMQGLVNVFIMYLFGGAAVLATVLSLCAIATNGRVEAGGTYYLISRSIGPELGGAVGLMFYCANVVGISFYTHGFTEVLKYNFMPTVDANSFYVYDVVIGLAIVALMLFISLVGSSVFSSSLMWFFHVRNVAILAGLLFILVPGHKAWTVEVNGHSTTVTSTSQSLATFRSNIWPYNPADYVAAPTATPTSPTPLEAFLALGDTTTHTPVPHPAATATSTATATPAAPPPVGAYIPPAQVFAVVFGVMFPSLTGSMAGTSMSGVLHRPDLSIPRGELIALLSALFLYGVYIFSAAFTVPQLTSATDVFVIFNLGWGSWGSWVISIGTYVSTLSSCGASLQAAGRLLQTIAQDNLLPLPQWMAATAGGPEGEPAGALIFSALLGAAMVFVPSLNAIAPIFTMFFLITYATTNFAAFVHGAAGHPNFRPRFRYFSPWVGGVGTVLCVGLMFFMQPVAASIALAFLVVITVIISFRNVGDEWGAVSESVIFHQVRKYLLLLSRRGATGHVKFWRAHILYLAHDPTGRVNLLETLNSLKKGGMFFIGEAVIPPADIATAYAAAPDADALAAVHRSPAPILNAPSSSLTPLTPPRPPPPSLPLVAGYGSVMHRLAAARTAAWQAVIEGIGLKAFPTATVANCFYSAAMQLFCVAGVGPLRPNSVVLHRPKQRQEEGANDEPLSRVATRAAGGAVFGTHLDGGAVQGDDGDAHIGYDVSDAGDAGGEADRPLHHRTTTAIPSTNPNIDGSGAGVPHRGNDGGHDGDTASAWTSGWPYHNASSTAAFEAARAAHPTPWVPPTVAPPAALSADSVGAASVGGSTTTGRGAFGTVATSGASAAAMSPHPSHAVRRRRLLAPTLAAVPAVDSWRTEVAAANAHAAAVMRGTHAHRRDHASQSGAPHPHPHPHAAAQGPASVAAGGAVGTTDPPTPTPPPVPGCMASSSDHSLPHVTDAAHRAHRAGTGERGPAGAQRPASQGIGHEHGATTATPADSDWSGSPSPLTYASAVSDLVDAGANVLVASRFHMLSLQGLFTHGRVPPWAARSAPSPRRTDHCDPRYPRIDVWVPPWEAVFNPERAGGRRRAGGAAAVGGGGAAEGSGAAGRRAAASAAARTRSLAARKSRACEDDDDDEDDVAAAMNVSPSGCNRDSDGASTTSSDDGDDGDALPRVARGRVSGGARTLGVAAGQYGARGRTRARGRSRAASSASATRRSRPTSAHPPRRGAATVAGAAAAVVGTAAAVDPAGIAQCAKEGDQRSIDVATQMAQLLVSANGWNTSAYIRVCTVVSTAGECYSLARRRVARLYRRFVRDGRIRCTFHVFILDTDAPDLAARLDTYRTHRGSQPAAPPPLSAPVPATFPPRALADGAFGVVAGAGAGAGAAALAGGAPRASGSASASAASLPSSRSGGCGGQTTRRGATAVQGVVEELPGSVGGVRLISHPQPNSADAGHDGGAGEAGRPGDGPSPREVAAAEAAERARVEGPVDLDDAPVAEGHDCAFDSAPMDVQREVLAVMMARASAGAAVTFVPLDAPPLVPMRIADAAAWIAQCSVLLDSVGPAFGVIGAKKEVMCSEL